MIPNMARIMQIEGTACERMQQRDAEIGAAWGSGR